MYILERQTGIIAPAGPYIDLMADQGQGSLLVALTSGTKQRKKQGGLGFFYLGH